MKDEPNKADEELLRLAIGEDGGDEGEEPSMGSDDEPEPKRGKDDGDEPGEDGDGEEAGEDGDEPEEGDAEAKRRKSRSKPEGVRIAELTARLRNAERELAALKDGGTGQLEEGAAPSPPSPDDFPLGDIDPEYTKAVSKWQVEELLAERDLATAEQREQSAVSERIGTGIVLAEEQAKAKYDDFDARIAEAVEARGGDPLPAPIGIALSVSPVGADLLYRLATDEKASERLEKLATGGEGSMKALALAFGELEGEYVEDDNDADLDLSDELDMARMLGRMRSRLKGTKAPEVQKREVRPTKAPEPPKERVRGGAGRFEVGDDTEDFAAFEAKVMGGKK